MNIEALVDILRDQGAYRNDYTEGTKETCAEAILTYTKDEVGKVADKCMYSFPKGYTNQQIVAFQKGIDRLWSSLCSNAEVTK